MVVGEQVQEAVKPKKMVKKKWDLSELEEDKTAFSKAKKRAKKEVVKAKPLAWREVEEEIEAPEGEGKLYRIAKARDKASKDFTQIKQIKDEEQQYSVTKIGLRKGGGGTILNVIAQQQLLLPYIKIKVTPRYVGTIGG